MFYDNIIYVKTDAANENNEKIIGNSESKKSNDADNDGLTNAEEQNIYKTNSFDADTDDDGLSDYQETKGWIWYKIESQGICEDFLKSGVEQVIGDKLCLVQKTDPLSQDTDQDGNSDFFEYNFLGAIATDADQDKDGLIDGQESGPNSKYHTSFLLYDTDGDGVSDGDEIKSGTNPLDPTDYTRLPKSGDEYGFEKGQKELPLSKIPPPTTAVNPPLVNPPISKETKGNEPPKVFSKTVLVKQNVPREIILTASDPNGQDRITFLIRSNPQKGELGPHIIYIDRNTAAITYTPYKGFVGTDLITYWAFDGKDFSRERGIIHLIVIP